MVSHLKIDKFEVTGPVREIYRKILIFAAFFFVLTGVWAWLISRGFTRPILRNIEFAEAISQGKYESHIVSTRKDELGDLDRSLNDMAGSLKEANWLKSGKEQLDDAIRGEMAPDQLAHRCLDFFIKYFEVELGALYLNNKGILDLHASHALTDRQGCFKTYSFGEGIVGQAAAQEDMLFFSETTEKLPQLNYGAGQQSLKHYLAAPIHSDGDVEGVLLLGSMLPFSALQKKFLEQNIANIAILFSAANSRQRIAELLASSQEQQEELMRLDLLTDTTSPS